MESSTLSKRAHMRSNVFVAATLSSASASGPARIRNLSAFGALIEPSELPQIGERVKLRRAELAATGVVVRQEGNKIGLQFERPIKVDDWLPAAGTKAQQKVDENFSTLKQHQPGSNAQNANPQLAHSAVSNEELCGIADMLDALADSLSEDPVIVERYLNKLQALDIASQNLRRLGNR